MHDSDSLLARGLDRLNVGFGIFDDGLRLVACNRPFLDLRNYPGELCRPGAPLEAMIRFNAERGDFGPGDVERQVAERMAEIKESGQREIEREMADGQILGIRYQHLEGGGVTITFEDKTEERRAQRALAASEERYALVSEAAEEAVYEWDIANDRFFSSPRLRDLLGVEVEDKGSRDWRWEDRIHPEDLGRYEATLRAHRSGERQRWECEYRFRDATGDYRWISDHGTSIRNEAGEAVRMVAAVRDITDRIEREAALAASEERHALVAQATSDGLYDWDVVNDVLYVSDRLNELFAFDEAITRSREWADRVHEDDIERYTEALRTHFKGGTDKLECQYRIVGRAGDYRWVRDGGIGVRDDSGRVVRLVGAVRDITDIKQAEERLDRAEARLLDSLETISDGFLLVDADDRVRLWNRRYMEIFGGATSRDISDIVREGMPFLDMVHEGYRRGMFKPHPGGAEGWIADRRTARQSLSSELEIELSNGHWILINERRMSDGGRVSVYTDITDLKRREAESEAARARFEDAIEALSSGFVLFDADDRIVVCNSKYRAYFPDLVDMVTPGTPFADIIAAAVDRGMFPAAIDNPDAWMAALLKRRAETAGIREQHLDSGLWLQISDHRTKDGGIVSIYTDVTELKTREAELIAARDAAEQALRDLELAQQRLIQSEKMASLGQLTAGIAHEIKNPLNFVNNFAKLSRELLEELAEILKAPISSLDGDTRDDAEDLFDTVKGNLDKINEHGRRADAIVKNMLLHSREGPSEMQRADLNAIAEEALNLAYHGARAESSDFNIEMVKELDAGVGEIDCYPQDLMRVFLNLISNGMYAANKRKRSAEEPGAGPEPRITVATRDRGDLVEVEVRDNGTGIAENIRDSIFTPFFTTKPAGEGTGLGLSLSYDIVVKQHGGTMTVDSRPGAFTAFVVALPRVAAGATAGEATKE